ncbi:MAG: NUDIX domain-containing protein [Oligoflexia bacterium]|nr:NUDIX domain-containing protein [Oligoflexia bacterium]
MKARNFLPSALHQLRRLYWRIMRPRTFGVSVIVVDKAGRVVLIRNTYRPGWHLPGGAVKRAERAADAAVRELREETNIECLGLPSQLLGIYANFSEGNFDHVTVYVVREWQQIAAQETNFEIEEMAWVELMNLPEETGAGTRRRIEEFLGLSPIRHDW